LERIKGGRVMYIGEDVLIQIAIYVICICVGNFINRDIDEKKVKEDD